MQGQRLFLSNAQHHDQHQIKHAQLTQTDDALLLSAVRQMSHKD
jgi:hypothetical protein